PNLNALFSAALGGSVTMLTGYGPLGLNDAGQLSLELPGLGISSAMSVRGALRFTAGGLTLDTVDGRGTAVLDLGNGMTLSGTVTLLPKANRIEMVFEDPVLTFDPAGPDMDLLLGGGEDVTTIDAAFAVGVQDLPAGAWLEVAYAKDASELVSGADAIFSLAAEEAGGELASLADVAFVVGVTEHGVGNEAFGDNTVTLTVSAAWYEA